MLAGTNNKFFSSYDKYLSLQKSKPRKTNQRKNGGIDWEYRTQLPCKPTLVDWVKSHAAISFVKSILVLGARWGADVRFLREGGYECPILAIDLFDPPLTSLVQFGDAHDLPHIADKVDLVWAYHVFEHFWKPSCVISQINKVCSASAVLFIAHPTWDNRDKYDAQDEYSSKRGFEDLLLSGGWQVKDYKEYYPKPGKRLTPAYIFSRCVKPS